jgi:hypothetical protein
MKDKTNNRYSKEFRNEAVKLVVEGGVSIYESSQQLCLPKSTLENWVRAYKKGMFDTFHVWPHTVAFTPHCIKYIIFRAFHDIWPINEAKRTHNDHLSNNRYTCIIFFKISPLSPYYKQWHVFGYSQRHISRERAYHTKQEENS